MNEKEKETVVMAHAVSDAAVVLPQGWTPDCYMPDWTAEKRHRFEELAQEMEWDLASIQEAAHALAGTIVVVIADDSGSMRSAVRNSPVPPPPGKHVTTRWDELMHFLSMVTRIGCELAEEVNFHFLNAGPVAKVQRWEQVAPIAARGPTGYTPLLGAMRSVFDKYDPAKTEQRLITIIATDGIPSDCPPATSASRAVGDLLRGRPSLDKSFVTFLSCTDNDEDIAYIKELDRDVRNVDEVDDYNSEKAEVMQAGKRIYDHFSVGDWALRAVVGATITKWDESDEQSGRQSMGHHPGGSADMLGCCLRLCCLRRRTSDYAHP
jgi:hypothetical protein